MALNKDRETPRRDGRRLVIGVAAATEIFGGGMVAVDGSGNALPAADSAGLKVAGIAEEHVDNSDGVAGEKEMLVERGRAYKLANSAANPVTAAHLLTDVYVEDDETVAATGGTNSIVAGRCIAVDSDGVWVEI